MLNGYSIANMSALHSLRTIVKNSCANQKSPKQCCSAAAKIGTICWCRKTSRNQEGNILQSKEVASSLLWKMWFPHVLPINMWCLSLDYQRITTQDKSEFAKLHFHTQISQALLCPETCPTIGIALFHACALFCFQRKFWNWRIYPRGFQIFKVHGALDVALNFF